MGPSHPEGQKGISADQGVERGAELEAFHSGHRIFMNRPPLFRPFSGG
jgi:hypothetical protein